MGVESIFETYTFLWSWQQYNAVWAVLKQTGLAYIPFFGILLNAFLDTYASQDPGESASTSLRIVEIQLFVALVVVVLAAQPLVSVNLKEIEYAKMCTGDELSTPEEDRKLKKHEYGPYAKMPLSKAFQEVKVPVWWYGVLSISHGLVYAAKNSMPCMDDVRQARLAIQTEVIDDPYLIRELYTFAKLCYFPTLSLFQTPEKQQRLVSAKEDEFFKKLKFMYGEADTQWLGSQLFLTVGDFYPSRMVDFPVSERIPGQKIPLIQEIKTKKFSCQSLWLGGDGYYGLKKILLEVYAEKHGFDRDSIISIISQDRARYQVGTNTLIGQKINAFRMQWAKRNPDQPPLEPDVLIDVLQNEFVRTLVDHHNPYVSVVSEQEGWDKALAVLGTTVKGITYGPELQVTRDLLPPLSAFILLVIVILLPVGLVFSGYTLEFLFMGSLALFTIKFWSYLWHVAWWVEQNLWSLLSVSPLYVEADNAERIIWLTSSTLYWVFPLLFTGLVSWAGVQMGGAISSAAEGLGSSTAESAGKAAQAVVREAVDMGTYKLRNMVRQEKEPPEPGRPRGSDPLSPEGTPAPGRSGSSLPERASPPIPGKPRGGQTP